MEGAFLYTLTLTDVATTWTECLPLLHRSQHGVIHALQRARGMFPFPLLGIDTDNGSEFGVRLWKPGLTSVHSVKVRTWICFFSSRPAFVVVRLLAGAGEPAADLPPPGSA
ncbi:MAG: hypothetical protein JO352_39725 [Chloroflexi bacterium]|nr:hypothetical protein [Chloroflexota bacterium]